MKKNVFSIFSVLSVLAFLVTGLFTSCEVGLGEAVDTYPPTLTLDYPANDGITVMNTFQMRGEAKDETYVKTVEVIVKSVKDNSVVKTYQAEVDTKAKTWSCAVNNKDDAGNFEISDGEYTFQMICTDSSDRTTELSRVYKIDNTAPVIVLKRPNSSDKYGRTIKLTGDISDENELSALYFSVFKNSGTEENPVFDYLGTQKYENISGVGLELVIGAYFDSDDNLSENERLQKTVYDSYYDKDEGGSQKFYCLVEVTDSSKEYRGSIKGDSASVIKPAGGLYSEEISGNISTCYYLETDIYDDILSKDGLNLQKKDLVSVFNGTFEETKSVTIAKIKEVLSQYAINTANITLNSSSFTLNPDNSPRYLISGYDTKTKSHTKGQPLTFKIEQGRDNYSLRSKSIRVVLREGSVDANNNFVEKENADDIVIFESYNNIKEMLSSSDENIKAEGAIYKEFWETVQEDEDRGVTLTDGDSINIIFDITGKTPVGTIYKTGKWYSITVEGSDLTGNEIVPSAGAYRILLKNGTAPVLEVTGGTEDNSVQRTPVDFSTSRSLSVSGAPIFNYSGTLDSDSGIEDLKVFYYITVKDEKPAKGETVKTWSTKKEDYADRTAVITENTDSSVEVPFLWSLEIPEGSEDFAELYEKAQADGKDLSDGLYLYTIYFYGYDGSQKTSTVSQRVHVDTQKPVVTMDGVTPLVEYEEASDLPYEDMAIKTDYVNGTVTFKGTVSDNYTLNNTIARAYLLEADGTKTSETAFATEEFGDSMSFSFVVDTSSVTEPKDMLVEIESTDKAGNTGDVVTKKVRIDQRTDEPRFIPSNADKTILDVTKLNESTNMFGKTSNNKIMGTVTDDDGVWGWQAYYSAGTSEQTASEWKLFASSTGIESTSANISVDLSKISGFTEGIYKIKIEVKDIVKGKGAVANSQVTSSDEFFIAIDEAAPALTITTEQNSYVSGTEGATVKGKISDGSQEIKSFKRTVYRVVTTTNDETGESSVTEIAIPEKDILSILSAPSGSAIKNGLEFTDVIDLNGEKNPGRVKYYITDKYDRESTAEFTYIIDNEDPTVSLSADLVDTTVFLAKGNAIKGISGTARDNIENGLSKVEYIISASETAAGITETDWTAFTGTYKWNSTINFGETTEGKKYVYIRAHDAAGNKTDAENYARIPVIIDAEAPVFDEDSFKVEYIDETGGAVPASEDGATRYANKLFKITGKVTDEYYKDLTCSIQTGTFDKTSLGKTGGIFTWTLNGLTDGSKNYVFTATDQAGQTTTKTVTIVIDRTAPTPKLGLSSYYSLTGTTYTVNEKITFTGSVTDANEVKSTVISAVKADDATETPVTAGGILPITAANASNFTESFDTTALEDGVYIFTVTSTDVAGNVGTAQIRVCIDQETDKPLITFSNADSAVTVLSDVNEQRNLFGKTSNNKILGSVSDDDKVGTITVQYTTDFDDAAAEIPADSWHTIGTYTATGSTYNLSIELKDEDGNKLSEGDYRLRVIAEDSKNPEADGTVPASKQTIVGPFYIGIDEGLPVIDINRQDGEMLAAEQSVSVTGKVSDGSGVVTLSRYRQKVKDDGSGSLEEAREETTIISVTGNTNATEWTDNFTSLASSEVLTYKAIDKYGRESTKSFKYQVDDADPTIVVLAPEADSFLGSAYGNTTKAFSGTAVDTNGTGKSGVKEILYRVGTINGSSVDYGTALAAGTANWHDTWLKADGTTTWNANIELGNSSSKKKVQILAVDGADRISTIEERTVTVDAVIPVITINSVTDTVNAASRTVSAQEGTYYVQSGYTISGTITEENLDTLKISGVLVTPVDNGDGTYSFTHSVTSPDAGQSTISIVALDKAGQQKDLSLNVFYDTSAPTPSFTITPIFSAKGWDGTTRENNVNGNVTIKGTSVDDDKVASSHLVIKYANGAKAGVKVYDRDTTNPTNFTGDVPLSLFIEGDGYNYLGTTVKIDDRQLYTVELTSTDRAGRVGIATSEVYVDESTDKPIVTLSNTNVDINSAADVSSESGHNLFNQTSNSKMLGTITDDDGIASIVVEYAAVTNGTAASYETEPLFSVSNVGTTYNFAADLKKNGASLAEGKYKIRITVLDTTEAAANHKTVEEFFLAIDNGAPSITVSTGSGYMKDNFTVEGKVSDAALKTIYRYAVTQGILASTPSAKWEAGSASNTIEYNSTTNVWTDSYSGITEPGTVAYIAADEYGQSTEVSWSYLFDNTAPTKAPGWTPSDMSAWSKNSAQQFKIPVSDEWNVTGDYLYDSCSGISTVNIKVDSDDASTMALGSAYDEFEKTVQTSTGPEQVKPYKYYNSTQILKDGHHTVVISASDNANPANTAANLATYEVNIDTTAPKYTLYTDENDETKTYAVKASKFLLTAADVANLTSNPFTLKVKPSDANAEAVGGAVSGIKEFKLYDGNTLIDSSKYELSPAANGTTGIFASGVEYTFTLNASAVNQTGNHNFYVETIDGAGNSVKESVSVSIDTTAPTISVNDPSPYVSVSGARKYNGIITISGKAEDETELGTTSALEYEVLSSAGASLSPRVTGTVDLTGGKSSDFSFDIDTTALTRSNATGTFKIKVTAKDKVQNTVDNSAALADGSSKLILNVDQTTDKPVVKLSNANVKVTTEAQISSTAVTSETASANKGNLFGMGNDSIFASATDDDGIAGIELKVFYNGSYKTVHKVGDESKPYFEVTDSPTSYPMEIDLTKVLPQVSGSTTHYAGTYKLAIVVTDIYNTSTMSDRTFTVNDDGVNGVYFAYDDDLPVINVTKINTTNYTDSMWARPESAIYIEVSDSSSTDDHTNLTVVNETLQWWDKDLNKYVDGTRETGEADSAVWDSTAGAWRFDSKNIDKTYKRKFRVTDKYGRSANKEITYKVDTVNPVFNSAYIALYGSSPSIDASDSNLPTIGVVIGTSKDFWFNSDAVKVIGRGTSATETALKEENPETVTVSVGAAGSAGATDYPVNPGTYNKFSTTISFVDGENIVRFNAKDKAELSATEVQTIVKVDTKAPVVSSVTASNSNINRKAQAALDTNPFYITVAVADANESAVGGKVSGISGFKVYRGTDDITSLATVRTGTAASSAVAAATDGVFADGTYYIHLASEAMTTGTHTFYVEAVDNAGNSKKEGTEAVSIDVTSPTMSWNVPSPYVTVSSAKKYNGIITVSGTVNDETLLATDDAEAAASDSTRSVSWEVKTAADASLETPYKGYATLSGTKTSAFSFEIDTTKVETESGTYRIYITAKDKVGNTVDKAGTGSGADGDYIEIPIDQSTNKPKVSLSNMSIYKDPEAETLVPVTDYDENNKGRNLFGMGSNTIYGTVSDDDGISAIVLKIDGNVVTKPGDATKPYFDDISGNPTSYTMQIDLSTINSGSVIGSGNHTLTIEVTDSSSSSLKDKTYIVNNDTVNGIYFAYDNDLPTISVVRCNDKDYTNNMWGKAAFDVYIQVFDASNVNESGVNKNGEGLTVECTEKKKSETGANAASYTPYTPASAETNAWSASWTEGEGDDEVTIATNAWKCSIKNNIKILEDNIEKIVNVEGYFQRTYKVSDIYGRSTTTTINYVVDSTAPAFNAEYITVQGTSNLGTSAIKVGDLTNTTWFNNSAIKIAGTGSSYTGDNTAIKEQNMESLVITVTGNETPNYNVNTSTNNKFTSTIEFGEGSAKSFYLTATDKAGNTTTSGTWAINVDTAKPTDVSGTLKKADGSAEIADDSTINYTSVLLSVAAKDTTSGVKTIYIGKTPGFLTSAAIKTIELDSANNTNAGYSEDITLAIGDNTKTEYLADGTYSLYVRVKDLAGNITDGDTALASFTVDRTPPAVTITSPVRTSVIDNDWVISGTVEDNNFVESGSIPELWVYKSGSWVEINTTNGYGSGTTSEASRNGNSWSIKLDSTKIDAASSHTTDAFLAVRITDKAGNVTALPTGTPSTSGDTYYYLTVNQDNDRPVIKFTEVSGDGSSAETTYLVKYATYIKGTVTDADGNAITGTNATVFKVSPTAITTPEGWAAFNNETSGNSLTNGKVERKASGDFTYTPANGEDGTHTVYFYYKDSKGTEFWTGHSDPLQRPYVVWADTEANVDNNSVITYRTDKSRPEFVAIVCGTGDTKAAAELDALIKMYGTSGQADEMATVTAVGGTAKKFIAFAVKAYDKNEIKKVSYLDPREDSDVEVKLTTKTTKYLNISTNTEAEPVAEDTDTVKIVEAYFFDGIDISGIWPSTGTIPNAPIEKQVTISVQDNSELDNDKQKTMQFTYIGPEISVSAPLTTDTVSAGNKATLQGSVESSATGVQNADLKFIYVNNMVYDALDSAGPSGWTGTTATGYTFPTSVTKAQKIAYIEAQATSHTEGHPEVHVGNNTDSTWDATATVTKFKWDISTVFPSEDTGAPLISYVPHNSNGIYQLPLWILATDTLGNKELLEYTIKYNPFGDRPTAQITYPEEKSVDGKKYAVISGTIRVSGSAQDNISVDSVYLQIDADNDEDFDKNDANLLITAGYSVYGTSAAKTAIGSESVTVLTGNFDADENFWGIKATGSQSWYTSLNSKGEFQNSNTIVSEEGKSDYYQVKVRAAALDNNNKLGAWTNALEIHIDPNAPAIGKNVKAYVLDSSGIKHEMTADMWVKGETYLCVSVQHSEGLTALSYQSSDDQSTINPSISLVDNSAVVAANAAITGTLITNWSSHPDFVGSGAGGIAGDEGYFLKIPLNTESGEGNRVIKITATTTNSSGSLTSEDIYTFKYDNVNPTIGTLKVNENETWGNERIALQNSNSKLSVKGDVQDDKSGFNFALWYFYRDDRSAAGKSRRVYDPSVKPTESNGEKIYSQISVTGATTDASTNAGYKTADRITEKVISGVPVYGKQLTVTRSSAGTITLPAVDSHITNGCAVYINGEWLFLSGSNDNQTFNLSSNVAATVTTAFFPYAKVTTSGTGLENAKNWNESNETIDKDDGDGIIESYDLSGTTATWSASFHGDYIPDGNVTFVYVAFDKSGNSAAVTKTGKVQNNPPRLSKLSLATDLNGDGYYGDNEFETYDILSKTSDYQSDYDLTTAGYGTTETETARTAFIVKDTLGVVPEFTGGNGDIALIYKRGDETAKSNDSTRFVTTAGLTTGTADSPVYVGGTATADTDNYKTGNTSFTAGSKKWLYKLTNANVTGKDSPTGSDDGTGKHISFTFWDSTDECVRGDDSQSCYVQLTDLTVDVTDGEAPKVVIEPFFWSGKGFTEQTVSGSKVYVPNNSLYYTFMNGDTNTGFAGENGKPTDTVNGHIDLSGDLPTGTFSGSTGEYDKDDKVSGKIVVRGTAYDDVRIDSLWVSFDDFGISGNLTDATSIKGTGTGDGADTSVTTTATTGTGAGSYEYTAARGGDGKSYYLAAKYNGTSWTTVGDKMTGNYWGFRIVDDGVNDQVPSEGAEKAFFDQRGHRVRWELYLDTAHLTNVAGTDKSIRVMAVDARGHLPSKTDLATATNASLAYSQTNKPSYRVDVVPYITGISTPNRSKSGLKDNNIRSASGKYSIMYAADTSSSVYVRDFITVKGFNLNPSNVRIVSSAAQGGSSVTQGTGTTVTSITSHTVNGATVTSASLNYTEFWASNVIPNSGYLEVFVRNGSNYIRSLNNINKTDAHDANGKGSGIGSAISDWENYYNREPDYNTTKNVQLTDDRYLRIFDMKKTTTKNGYYPVMFMEDDDPVFGFIDSNGWTETNPREQYGYAKDMHPQRKKFDGSTGQYVAGSGEFLIGGIAFDQMAMARDDAGKYIHATVHNFNNGSMGVVYDKFASLYTDKSGWLAPGSGYQGQSQEYAYNNNNNALTLEGMQAGGGLLMERYKAMKLIAKGNSTKTNGATIYMAYLDDKTSNIWFRDFKIGTSNNIGTRRLSDVGNTRYYTNQTEITYTTDSATGRYSVTTGGSVHYDFGIASNRAVFVYYDFAEGRLKLKYSTANISGNPSTTVSFAENTSIELPEYVGQYVSMAIDTNGGIHIAAFDANGSDLKYIYLTSYNATTYTEVTVDAAGSVGNWTSIKINNENKPVIAYYNATETGGHDAIKLAISRNVVGSVTAGIDSSTDYTSTGWEYMTIPSIDPAQGGSQKFQQVCLDFDSSGNPVVGYLGTNLEFGKQRPE